MVEKSYQLIMQRGPKPGQVYQLHTSTVTIGRDPMVDVVINDPEVSRQHVRLVRTDTGYQIQDLGSTNGTFINGRRLGGDPHQLQVGEEVLLGSSITLLYMDAPDSDSVPAFPPAATIALDADATSEEVLEPGEDAAAAASDPFAAAAAPSFAEAQELSELAELAGDEPDTFGDAGAAEPETDAAFSTEDLRPEDPWEEEPSPAFTPVATPQPEPFPAPDPPVRLGATPGRSAGQPLVPPGESQAPKRRNRTLMWVLVVAVALMLCCCAFLLSAYYVWGDPLMRALGFY